ncbi:MAG: tRNA dihydrouridine synthase DusB [Oscillospiraceae bacterium]|nr:tRNA dihydrouridine synthase DusB [Oscillospiraceae bacterium]
MRIGQVEIAGRAALGPMAGVTDAAFRHICRRHGAALTCTEMVSSRGLVYHDEKTKELLFCPESDHPVCAQIFGSDPVIMGEAAAMAVELSGADILDINMGCPVGKVVKSGDGSALMKTPDLAFQIIQSCARQAGVPVTVKFRKGWDGGHVNAVEFGILCQQAGAAAIAVHGRTRVQMYAGVADWDIIRDVKAAVTIPVIANGDVFSGNDARRLLQRTGADMCMVGRGSFGDPWLFEWINAALDGQPEPELPPLSRRLDEAVEQFTLACRWKDPKIACLEARKQLAWYFRGVPHSGPIKQEIVKINTLDDIERIVRRAKRELCDP